MHGAKIVRRIMEQKMNRTEFFEEWADALESGEFQQGGGQLNYQDKYFCCLGVACELLHRKGLIERYTKESGCVGYGKEKEFYLLPSKVHEMFDLNLSPRKINGFALSAMNDNGISFAEIAKIVRSGDIQ